MEEKGEKELCRLVWAQEQAPLCRVALWALVREGEAGLGETWKPGCHCQPHHALSSPATGSLNLLVRSRNKGALDTHAWSLSGNKGNVWQQAHVPINPSGPFQVSGLAKVPCRFLGG